MRSLRFNRLPAQLCGGLREYDPGKDPQKDLAGVLSDHRLSRLESSSQETLQGIQASGHLHASKRSVPSWFNHTRARPQCKRASEWQGDLIEPPGPFDHGHRNCARSYNKNTTKSHSLNGVYEKTASFSADLASYGLYMTYTQIVQYSGSSASDGVELQVLSRAS